MLGLRQQVGRDPVGIAGLVGAGRSELALTLIGALKRSAGTVTIDGRQSNPADPRIAKNEGFALIPEDTAVVIGFGVAVMAAVAIVRTLGLPWWWRLFPPLAHGVVVTNPHVLLTALLLTNRAWAEALAGLVKIYAVVPLGGRFRWRALALTGIGLGVSFALAPHLWLQYVATMAETTARLNEEAAGGFSAAIVPSLLLPMTLLVFLLWLMDRRAGSWLAVPALWPASQFFTQTFAMPLFARGSAGAVGAGAASAGSVVAPAWLAALLAIPSRGVVPLAIAIYVVTRLWQSRRAAIEARRASPAPSALRTAGSS